MQTLFQIALFMHICGFIVAIGVAMVSLITYNQFWKLYAFNREQGIAAFRAFSKLQVAGMIGLMVVLAAGITMLAIVHWAYATMLWMHIKLTLVALIFVNGFTLGRTSTLKLRKLIAQDHQFQESSINVRLLRRQSNLFLILQLIIFVCIIFLSVFRFT